MNYEQLASEESIAVSIENLRKNGFEAVRVRTKGEALEEIKKAIPTGASVMNGLSKTLSEIGFTEYLKEGKHGWNNLHDAILAEKDPKKQMALRRQATLAEYFVNSVNAVTETGELVNASGTGSQIPSIAYNSDTVLLVVGVHKIVPTLDAALKRVREHVVPLEDRRMKDLGRPGTLLSKMLIYEKHSNRSGRRVVVILVDEKLGF